jgi:hypothetical protein
MMTTKQITSTTDAGTLRLTGKRDPLQVTVTTYDDGSTYTELTGTRGAAYFLRQVGMTDTGVYEVTSWKSGAPLRDRCQRPVRVVLLGGVFEEVAR